MDGKISQQRVYCKIQAQLGFLPTKIHADLQKVYGNGAVKYATVCKWVRHLNDGPELIENEPRVGIAGFHFDGKEHYYCENVN